MIRQKIRNNTRRRRAAAAVMVVVTLPVIIGFAALSVDMGMLYKTQAEIQRSADAAALAAAWELLDEDALAGSAEMSAEEAAARMTAVAYAARNQVHGEAPVLDGIADVVVGYRGNPLNRNEALDTSLPDQLNAVRVFVRRDDVRNGPISLAFAHFFGFATSERGAAATAYISDSIGGFRVTETTGNASLVPFALHADAWADLLNGISNAGDDFGYDSYSGEVTNGGDGILELNIYPGGGLNNGQNNQGAGEAQLAPGNFGTVDIGDNNNSTADLSRQILHGVSADDLAHLGGELKLGEEGTILLNGDSGLSAGFKDDLEAVKGQPRTIPLFNHVTGSGNNSMYTIVGFAGVRIVDVKLTDSISSKAVIVQPAHVVDDSAISSTPGSSMSYFVHSPPYLID